MSHALDSEPRPKHADSGAVLKELPRLRFSEIANRFMRPDKARKDMLSGLDTSYRKYGNAVSAPLGIINMVNLFGPDANRLVLLDQERIFSARKPWMDIMGRIFPDGLLLLDGDEHKRDRKIMHTAFTRPALRGYAEQMNSIVEQEIEDWIEPGATFHAFPKLKELTLTMAAKIFVGIELGPKTRKLNQAFEDLVAASMSIIKLRIPGLEFYRGLKGREFMIEFIGGMIEEKRAGDSSDIFSHLCRTETEDGERFGDQQIIDHMSFLMMAAHDTTTSTLTSIFYELGRHPEWQERLREESNTFGSDHLSFDGMVQFPQVELVMKEVLRRFPPLPIIPRVNTEEFEFDGFRVPKSSMVVISPLHTHYMDEWWDDPQKFDPERFSPERAEDKRHSHSFVAFGGGPHMCLGLRFAETQVKVVLHHVLQKYRWSVPAEYTMPVQQAPISKPQDGLPLKLERI
jgi:cytochrome P450